jgi:hypothetical protein|nr:MAG TPA: head to tail connecting protein [Bacteriophage sp.]
MTDVKELKQLVSHLEGLRTKRLAQQYEIGRLILPSRGLFRGEETESLRDANLFNPVAQRALRKAAAGMTQAITPASDPWFRHAFLSRADREATGGNEYVDTVDARIRAVLSAGSFYQAVHAFNKELLAFGCALLSCESSPRTVARFACQTCGTYAVALDEDRMLACVVRRLKMTPRELAERFGRDRLSDVTRKMLDDRPYAPVEVVHVVQRRENADASRRDGLNMPFASYWYEENGEHLLHEGGFRSMPFFFTVWEEARGIYGAGPGDEALADQKGIEAWELRKMLGIEKMIDPPLLAPGTLKRHVRVAPGEVVSDSAATQNNALRPLYEVNFGPAVQYVQQEVQQISMRLEDVMMANIFANMSLETRPAGMTMTEYMDRRRRSAELMGPTVSAYEPRVLNPLIERVFALLDEAGMLPPPPDGLSEWATLSVSYQSPMAQMLEQSGAVATAQFMEQVAPLVQVNPEIFDKLDTDQMVDELAQRMGVPASIIRSDEQVAAIRRQRAEAQAAQQAQAVAMMQAEAAAKLGGVSTQGTVAGAVLGADEEASS